ncbi:MAG TPA: phosphate uptake regulator PhoU [Trebonia sp.]|jgi:phosphate transport system protein|nr:phosphate uptake regulator PhoU [Trebonia sp.]
MTGFRSEFDRRLEAIEARVIELFGIIAEDLPGAAGALLGGCGEVAGVLAARERAVDALYAEAEELACREVLLQAPVGADLRFLLSVLRVAPELERSHDLVVQIASGAGRIAGGDLSPRVGEVTGQMGELASGMWVQAANAWYARDRCAVSALGERGQEMSQLHDALTAELARGQLTIPVTMEMTLIAHCYGRLGAHAVNIARRVAYLAGAAA